MKSLLCFLAVFYSLNLTAKLDPARVGEALIEGRLNESYKDKFFYEVVDDPEAKKQLSETNKFLKEKVFGPYRLVLKDVPPRTKFEFYQFNLLGIENPQHFASGYIDEAGEAWLTHEGKTNPLSTFWFVHKSMLPGEPIYSLIQFNDQENYLFAYHIPNPFIVCGKENQTVSLELLTSNGLNLLVQGNRFKPNENITISFETNEGVVSQKKVVSSSGKFAALLKVAEKSKELEIKITSETTNHMTLKYHWETARNSAH